MSRGIRASSLGAEARLGRARSPVRFSAPFNGTGSAMQPGEEKETMRGLNERLADYLSQVRLLEEANSRLEAQIKEVVTERRAAGQRDWSGYERILSTLRDQVKEMTKDNASLMLQIDNSRLAADDFKVKLEAEFAVRCAVEHDITNLRKVIDDTHVSSMQLEAEIETLTEELMYRKKNHEEEIASLKGQIRNSSVDVQMEAAKGQDLSETIDNIRKQYEKATQKSREETEAWYQNKFENISAEVSRNTDALQQGKSELNELRRQKQGLEIELQGMHNMNRSLEDTLNDTLGCYSQNVNSHNIVIQQLEAELAEVHAQVMRQGAEYQALLNIKSKLEEEIATYHGLLEGIGLPSNYIADSGLDENGDFRGMGGREELDINDFGLPEDANVNDKDTFEDGNAGGNGSGGFDDSVEFSLEQALNAAPRNLNTEPTPDSKIVEENIVAEKDLELNAANTAMNKQYDQKEDGHGMKEDRVILEEMVKEETLNSTEMEVQVNEEEEVKVEEKVNPLVFTGVLKIENAESHDFTLVGEVEGPVVNTQGKTESPKVDIQVEKTESPLEKAESPVVEMQVVNTENPVENTESPVVEMQVEKTEIPLEKAESPVVEIQVENPEIPVVEIPVENPEIPVVEIKVENPEIPVVEISVENPEIPVVEISVENPQIPVVDIKVENPEIPVVEIKVENPEIPVVEIQVENPEIPVVDIKVENPEIPVVEIKVENPEIPVVEIQVENPEIPVVEIPVEKIQVESTQTNEEVPLKQAAENINAAEEKKKKGEELENPEAEPLLKVEE